MVRVDQTMASKESLHRNSNSFILCEDLLDDTSTGTKRKLKQNVASSKKRYLLNVLNYFVLVAGFNFILQCNKCNFLINHR